MVDTSKPAPLTAIVGGKLLTITHGIIENGVLILERRQDHRRWPSLFGQSPRWRNHRRRQGHDYLSRPHRLRDQHRPLRDRIQPGQQRPRRTHRRDLPQHARVRRLSRRDRTHPHRSPQRHHQRHCRPRQLRHHARPGHLHPARRRRSRPDDPPSRQRLTHELRRRTQAQRPSR